MANKNYDSYIVSKPTKDIKNTFSGMLGGIGVMEIVIFSICFVIGAGGIALICTVIKKLSDIAFYICLFLWIILFIIIALVLISTDANTGIKRWKQMANKFRFIGKTKKQINRNELISILNVESIKNGTIKLKVAKSAKLVKFFKLEGINIDLLSAEESNRLVSIARHCFVNNEMSAKLLIVDQAFDIHSHDKYLHDLINESKDSIRTKQLQAYLEQNKFIATNDFSKGIYLAIIGKDEKDIAKKERFTIAGLQSVNVNYNVVTKDSEIVHVMNTLFNNEYFSEEYDQGFNPSKFANLKVEKNCLYDKTHFTSILEIKQFPNFVQSGWMKQLANCLSGRNGAQVIISMYPASTNSVVHDMSRAKFRLKANWEYIKNEGEQVNSAEYFNSYTDLIQDLAQGNKIPWKFHAYIVLKAETKAELMEARKEAIKSLKNAKYKLNLLECNQKDAYSCIFKFSPLEWQTVSIATNDVIAAGFPFWSNALNDPKGLGFGYDYYSGTPFFLDFKFKDNQKRNSNVFTICGQVGGGKSYCTKHIINWLRNTGCKQFIIAPTDDYDNFKANYDKVKVINVTDKKQGLINPLQIFDNNKSIQMHINEFIGWLSLISNTDVNDSDERIMVEVLSKLYAKFKIKDGDDFINIDNNKWPTGDDLYHLANKELDAKDIRQKLIIDKFWQISKDGKFGHLWNGHTSINVSKDNMVIFQTKDVSADNAKDKLIMNGIMYLLFNFINSELQKNLEHNKKTNDVSKFHWISVVVDEAHRLINKKNPIALNALIAMAKEIRHYQGILINVTQSISDFKKGGGDDIIKQSLYHIIFHQSAADIADYEEMLKEVGGLTDQGKEFVSMARRGEALVTIGNYYRSFVSVEANEVNSAMWEAKKVGYN